MARKQKKSTKAVKGYAIKHNGFYVDMVPVIWWDDLENSKDFDETFDSFSYGDAGATLVPARQVYDEIAEKWNQDGRYDALIAELKEVGAMRTWVGFGC